MEGIDSPLPVLNGDDPYQFRDIERALKSMEPFILRKIDCGECMTKWQEKNYLKSRVGPKPVIVHESSNPQLEFLSKNFKYRTMPFDELIEECGKPPEQHGDEHRYFYFRATSNQPIQNSRNSRGGPAARLESDFPSIAQDIQMPSFIPENRVFSSILRISSSDVVLWMHYDIMDNILIQVSGRKEISLFSPHDLPYLYIEGDKSLISNAIEPDYNKFPLFSKATPFKGLMNAGDAVFIPALWFHVTKALSPTIGVNIFWKTLPDELYDPKDIYGNKDLLPAQNSRKSLEKIITNLSSLPETYQEFYTLSLIEKLKTTLKNK